MNNDEKEQGMRRKAHGFVRKPSRIGYRVSYTHP
jgi:hypothetical protein